MIVVSIIQCILYLLLVPVSLGIAFTRHFDKKYNTIGNILTCGFLTELGIFQVLFIGCYFFDTTMTCLTWLAAIILIASSVVSLIFNSKTLKSITYPHFDFSFCVFLLFVLYMIVLRNVQNINDGDDAFVIGNAVTTIGNDHFYKISYYNGKSLPPNFLRHLIASSPIFISFVSKVSFLHPATVAHRILGSFYLLLHSLLIYDIGSILFEEDKKRFRGVFASLVSLITIWDFHSYYTDSTFILMRTWQGKAMFCGIAVPFVFLLFLMIGNDEKNRWIYYIVNAVLSVAAVAMTPSAVYMSMIQVMVLAIGLAFVKKKFSIAVKSFLSTLPLIMFGLLYIYIVRG